MGRNEPKDLYILPHFLALPEGSQPDPAGFWVSEDAGNELCNLMSSALASRLIRGGHAVVGSRGEFRCDHFSGCGGKGNGCKTTGSVVDHEAGPPKRARRQVEPLAKFPKSPENRLNFAPEMWPFRRKRGLLKVDVEAGGGGSIRKTNPPGPRPVSGFENVIHAVLLRRLMKMGASGQLLEGIRGWLASRAVAVAVDGRVGKRRALTRGIPQGNRISPLLQFSIFLVADWCCAGIKPSSWQCGGHYHVKAILDDWSMMYTLKPYQVGWRPASI